MISATENFGINSAAHSDLDPVKLIDGQWIFPGSFIAYYDEFAEVEECGDKKYCISGEGISRQKLTLWQDSCYNVEHWYKLVPTIPTWVSEPLSEQDIKEIRYSDKCKFVDKEMERIKLESKQKSFFLRLNSVSPKDAKKPMEVKDRNDVIKLLKESGRVNYYFDNLDEKIPIRLVFREWIEKFPIHMEFRCFISGNKLRAISQYACYTYFKELDDKKIRESILKEIIEFYEKIKYDIPYEDAVMDIVKLDGKWLVVEFNPFGAETGTGAGLFNWKDDYEVLYRSSKPVIRFVDKEN
jgi:hypothetical protein